MAFNEYEESIQQRANAEGKAQPDATGLEPANEYEESVAQRIQGQREAVKSNLFAASKTEPSHSAEAIKIAEKYKYPVQFVSKNLDKFKEREKQATMSEYEKSIAESRGLQKFMSKPENASVARDDIESLRKVEASAVRFKPAKRDDIKIHKEYMHAAGGGLNQLGTSLFLLSAAYGNVSKDEAANMASELARRQAEIKESAPSYVKHFEKTLEKEGGDVQKAWNVFLSSYDEYKRGNILDAMKKFAGGGGMTVGETLDLAYESLTKNPRAVGYMTIESLANSFPSLVGGAAGGALGVAAGGPVAPVTGAIGFMGGTFAGSVIVEVGATIQEEMADRGIDMSDTMALRAAMDDPELMADIKARAERKGITTAALDAVFSLFAGQFLSKSGKGLTKKAAGAAADVATQAVGETVSEFGGQIAKEEGDLSKVNLGDAVTEGIISIGHSVGETVSGAARESALKVREKYSRRTEKAVEQVTEKTAKVITDMKKIEAIAEAQAEIRNTKNIKEVPSKVKEFIHEAGGEAEVYFQADDWDSYWQRKKKSPAEMAEKLLKDGGKGYHEAKSNGNMLEMSVGDLVAASIDDTEIDGLLDVTRVSVDGMTIEEAREHFKELPQIMETLAEEAMAQPEVQMEAEASEIGRDVMEQLKATGMKEKEARLYSKVYEAGFRAMAERSGVTPQELYSKYGLKIRGTEQLKAGSRMAEGSQEYEQQDVSYDEDSGYRVETDEVKASGDFMSEDGALDDFINPEGVFDDEIDVSQFDDIERPFLLESIEVNPELRGQGLGKDAMLSMEAEAVKNGADAIFLNASPMGMTDKSSGLDDLIGFYESLGYEVIRRSDGNAEMFKRVGQSKELYQQDVKSPEFKQWFGESKVVDESGEPLVVYHGSNAEFDAFDISKLGSKGRSEGPGFYFTNNKKVAQAYEDRGTGQLVEAYISMEKPLVYSAPNFDENTISEILTKYAELELLYDPDLENDVMNTSLVSNGYTVEMGLNNDLAVDFISELVGSGANTELMLKAVKEVTGHDGIVSKGYQDTGDGTDMIYIPFQPTQIKSVNNRGTFDPNDTRILYQSAQPQVSDLGFYSKMDKLVQEKIQGKAASVEQVRALTKDMKPEEVKWLGLDDFLKDKKKVSKDELLDFIRMNTVQIEEVVLGVVKGESREEVQSTTVAKFREFADSYYDAFIASNNMADDDIIYYSLNDDGDVQTVSLADDISFNRQPMRSDQDPKFSQYTLPGGENYREVLLTMPPRGADAEVLAANQKMVDKVGAELDLAEKASEAAQKEAISKFDKLVALDPSASQDAKAKADLRNKVHFVGEGRKSLELNEHQQKELDRVMKSDEFSDEFKSAFIDAVQAEKKKTSIGMDVYRKKATLREVYAAARETEKDKGYTSGHFDQANILAHFRLIDRIDANGNRVLFIEEIQSDWHQAGRKRGYRGDINIEVKPSENGFGIFSGPERIGFFNTEQEAIDASKLPYYKESAEQLARQGSQVPDAPFRKTWHEFALKRILRMAAEQGYDSVAWTTGEQQAERYDLSKQLDKIIVTDIDNSKQPHPTGGSTGLYLTATTKDGISAIDRWIKDADELSDYIGKEAADKILKPEYQSKKYKNMKIHILENADLKVGGEGMKGFYDNILVKSANKLVKKFGGKVGESELDADRSNEDIEKFDTSDWATDFNEDTGNWLVVDEEGEMVTNQVFSDEAAANQYIKDGTTEDMGRVKVHSLPITPELRDAAMGGFELFQDQKRGRIQISPDRQINIDLLENANLSTFLHESGHLFLEIMGDLNEADSTNPEVKADYQALLDWFGVESRDQITTEHHEMFARGFEQYLMEGKAPSTKLKKAFQRFRQWLVAVYRELRNLNVQLTDEVRDVMNRMLATEEEIKQVSEDMDFDYDPDTFGMTGKYAEKQTRMRDEAGMAAEEEMLAKVMDGFTRKKTRQYKEARKKVKAEVTEEIDNSVVYKALALLQRGTKPDGSPLDAEPFKIDRQALVQMYDPEFVKNRLPRPFIYAREGGIHPDVAAQLFGFESGDQMITSLASAPPRKEAIERMTDQRMAEEYQDLLADDDKLEETALKAIHTDKRAQLLRNEMEWMVNNDLPQFKEMTKRAIKAPPPDKFMKEKANAVIGRRKVRDVKPYIFLNAQRKARSEAATAWGKGDFDAAYDAKMKELLNYYMYKEALNFKETLRKDKDRFKRFRKKDEDLAKSRDINYVQAGRAVLAAYGLGPATDKSPLEHLESIRKYDEDAYNTIRALVDDAIDGAAPVKEISMDDYLLMSEAVKGLWDLSKSSKEIEVDGKKKDLNAAVDELVAGIAEYAPKVSDKKYRETKSDREKDKIDFLGLRAMGLRFETWVDIMDNGDINGVFRSYLFDGVSKAKDQFDDISAQYIKKFKELSEVHARKINYNLPIESPELNFKFKHKAELLGALQHIGNNSNKTKLLVGYGWGALKDDGTLDSTKWDQFINRMIEEGMLTKDDFDYIQSLWDLLEEIKPLAQVAHKEVFGFHFSEITADAVETPFGTYRGGYAPAKVDPYQVKDVARKGELDEFIKGHSSFEYPAAGGRGFTKKRVDQFNKPLNLDIGKLPRHIEDVLRFSIIKPRVVDVAKIVMNQRFKEAMSNYDSSIVDNVILPALNRIDKNTIQQVDPGSNPLVRRWSGMLRANASLQIMFANIINTAEQVAGFSIAATRVSPKAIMKAGYRFMANPRALAKEVNETSQYMRTRTDDEMFEIKKTSTDIFSEKTMAKDIRNWSMKHGYFAQILTQNLVDNIVWQAGYDDGKSQGLTHERAVAFADSVIRQTQGSRRPGDISKMESYQWLQFFQMFMNFFNMLANLNYGNFVKLYRSDMGMKEKSVRGMYLYMMGFASVAVVSAMLRKLAAGKGLDEDDDGEYVDDLWDVFGESQVSLATGMIPIIGPAVNAGLSRTNDKQWDDRVSASPAIEIISGLVGTGAQVVTGSMLDDNLKKREIRDGLTALGIITGMPLGPLSKPLIYLKDVSEGEANPSGPFDFTRGLMTGKPGE